MITEAAMLIGWRPGVRDLTEALNRSLFFLFDFASFGVMNTSELPEKGKGVYS